MKDEILDEAVAAVRDDLPPAAEAEAAASRALARIAQELAIQGTVETIRGCADVRALLPALRQGTLPPQRTLVVEDHLRECAGCRLALRGGPSLAVLPWRRAEPGALAAPRRPWRLAVAAGLALVPLGLLAVAAQRMFVAAPAAAVRATVESVSGVLQLVAGDGTPLLRPGASLGEAERVRTARASRAHLRLGDGSIVEMSERAELSLLAHGNDLTILLDRGNIIVQAAKRRSGRLLVVSKDCTVYVTGTVFSVASGLKGSRVSVIEGLVRVVGGGDERRLEPGQQWTTNAAMEKVPVAEEIAWSRDLDSHLALLGEIEALREKWTAVRVPELRYESRILGALPEATVVFASLPNYGEALSEAHRLFEERLAESAVLREWWLKADPARHGGPSLAAVVERVRGFADYLGDEIAFVAVEPGGDRGPIPFLVAELRRPGLRDFIEGELAGTARRDTPVVRILDEVPARSEPGVAGVFVLLRPDLVVVSPDAQALRLLAGRVEAGAGLAATPFGQRIVQAYQGGVGLLFAADLERIGASVRSQKGLETREATLLHDAGIDGLRYLLVERKQLLGHAHTAAVLDFTGPRRGVASWLAAPGPMGALDFVSPNAQVVAAFLSKSPSLVLDDIRGLAETGGGDAARAFGELQQKLDLRLREDIADTLGGEFALALDGPILPTPSWKLVAEVYDADKLQRSLQVLVGKAADAATAAGRPGVRLDAEQVNGQVYYRIHGGNLPVELHYGFASGYLVMAPSRALVMQALRARQGGESLSRSAAFLGLFPSGRQDYVSGLVYQNLGGTLGSLLDLRGPAGVSDQQRRAIESLGKASAAALLCAYGGTDGIEVAGIGGGLDLDPASLALPLLLSRGLSGTAPPATP